MDTSHLMNLTEWTVDHICVGHNKPFRVTKIFVILKIISKHGASQAPDSHKNHPDNKGILLDSVDGGVAACGREESTELSHSRLLA